MQAVKVIDEIVDLPQDIVEWLKDYRAGYKSLRAMSRAIGIHYNTMGPILNGSKTTVLTSTLNELKRKKRNAYMAEYKKQYGKAS